MTDKQKRRRTNRSIEAPGDMLGLTFLDLTSVYFKLSARTDALLKEYGLSSGRMGILRSLNQLGPKSISEIARLRPVSRQGVQRMANELVALGLVEVENSAEDRRSKILSLTQEGRSAYKKAARAQQSVMTALASDYDAEELENARKFLKKLEKTAESI